MKTQSYRVLIFVVSILLILGTSSCRKDSKRAINKHHRKSVGTSARDLLSDKKYESLVIEIQYMAGYKPTEQAVQNLKDFLTDRLHKGEIEVTYSEIPAQNKSSYSLKDIQQIEDDNRTEFTAKKQIATYFLFLDGSYSENTSDSKVLGVAYYNTSMAIFEETVADLTNGIGEPDRYKLETTVINHEFGHILGLVNLGSNMVVNHQDAANGNHCDNENCLMNWHAETGDIVGNLLGSSAIPVFDGNCLSDLQKNGGK